MSKDKGGETIEHKTALVADGFNETRTRSENVAY
jgi:hypothetical protein